MAVDFQFLEDVKTVNAFSRWERGIRTPAKLWTGC
jgi:hypothetical protein